MNTGDDDLRESVFKTDQRSALGFDFLHGGPRSRLLNGPLSQFIIIEVVKFRQANLISQVACTNATVVFSLKVSKIAGRFGFSHRSRLRLVFIFLRVFFLTMAEEVEFSGELVEHAAAFDRLRRGSFLAWPFWKWLVLVGCRRATTRIKGGTAASQDVFATFATLKLSISVRDGLNPLDGRAFVDQGRGSPNIELQYVKDATPTIYVTSCDVPSMLLDALEDFDPVLLDGIHISAERLTLLMKKRRG